MAQEKDNKQLKKECAAVLESMKVHKDPYTIRV